MLPGFECGRVAFIRHYRTPGGFDDLVMSSDGEALTGLWFEGSRDGAARRAGEVCPDADAGEAAVGPLPVFRETCRWLDVYFSGRQPGFTPPYRLVGATPFREEVSGEMLKIPFGATTTYGAIAALVAKRRGMAKMSAQAVGQAVGWNPICIIVPCHRVVGAGGAITGYGGGIANKAALLRHEARL